MGLENSWRLRIKKACERGALTEEKQRQSLENRDRKDEIERMIEDSLNERAKGINGQTDGQALLSRCVSAAIKPLVMRAISKGKGMQLANRN